MSCHALPFFSCLSECVGCAVAATATFSDALFAKTFHVKHTALIQFHHAWTLWMKIHTLSQTKCGGMNEWKKKHTHTTTTEQCGISQRQWSLHTYIQTHNKGKTISVHILPMFRNECGWKSRKMATSKAQKRRMHIVRRKIKPYDSLLSLLHAHYLCLWCRFGWGLQLSFWTSVLPSFVCSCLRPISILCKWNFYCKLQSIYIAVTQTVRPWPNSIPANMM